MKKAYIFFGCLIPVWLFAQTGGRVAYDFLNLPASARILSLGGLNVSLMDDDPHFAAYNPALATDSMHQRAVLSFSNYLSDISAGYAGYSHTIDGVGSLHTGVQFVNYGNFAGADEFGNPTGDYGASELAWYLGIGRAVGNFRGGVNMKFISSSLAPGYTSVGMALDLGIAYQSEDKLFSAGMVIRNAGLQFSNYTGTSGRDPLPLDVAIGISNKLRYMPLRFSVTLNNLHQPNLIVKDPNAAPVLDLSGNPVPEKNQLVDNLFRHAVFGGEFLMGRALRLRFGYNHLRRQELKSSSAGGFAGFSIGAGIRVARFAFDYGYGGYGAGQLQYAHQFSLMYAIGH